MNSRRSTAREQGRIDNHLIPYFTGRKMTAISSDTITSYIVARQQAHATGGTINRETAILKRAFRLALRAGKLTTAAPYIPKLRESEPRQGFFERAEFDAVRDKLPAHLQPLLTFYYWTGWRSSEALSLQLRHVNLAEGAVRLDAAQSKNGQARVFPFAALDELRDVLTKQVESAERLSRETTKIVTAVFHNPDGSPVSKSEWRTAWEAARTAAGYPAKLVHDFRRTAARNLVRAGVPETVAMKLTGHKTRSMFDRYNITSGDDLRAAGELLQAYVTEKPKAAKKQAQVRQFRRRNGS
jgi:integrase